MLLTTPVLTNQWQWEYASYAPGDSNELGIDYVNQEIQIPASDETR